MLTSMRRPISFNELKIVHSVVYLIVNQAYVAMDLLENDDEWVNLITEAAL